MPDLQFMTSLLGMDLIACKVKAFSRRAQIFRKKFQSFPPFPPKSGRRAGRGSDGENT